MKMTTDNKELDPKKEHAKRYLLKYIKELKVHFDLSDDKIKEIMRDVYYSQTYLYKIAKKFNKYFKDKK